MKLVIVIFVVTIGSLALSFPQYYRRAENHGPRSPQRTLMLSSYYGSPNRRYVPQTAMTAFASGSDTIATGTYNGEVEQSDESTPENKEVLNQKPTKNFTELPIEVAEEEEEQALTTTETIVTTKKTKKVPKRKQKPQTAVDEDEDDDENDSWPFGGGRRGSVPNFTFFPIMFGSSFGRSTDGSPSGAATAIANSFSTGKGGVASSHATAFGDSDMYKNLKKSLKKKAPAQSQQGDDE